MNHAITAEDFGFMPPEGVMSFLASRSKTSARAIPPAVNDVFRGCAEEIKTIVANAIEARTRAEFRREVKNSFPKYVGVAIAISHVANALVSRESVERLTRESICEMESDFREYAMAAFGEDVRNQALFTVWTLRKVNDLVDQIVAARLDDAKKAEDGDNCTSFNYHLFRAHFSLECLNLSLEKSKPIYPEVIDELTDMLRSMVNAYAHARRGLELRVPTVEPSISVAAMDEEDNELLDLSMSSAEDIVAQGL